MPNKLICVGRHLKKHLPTTIISMAAGTGAYFLFENKHEDLVPSFLVSCLALVFSTFAYKFSMEKFRLDLLDRRWDIYEEVLKFTSIVAIEGGLPRHNDSPYSNENVKQALLAAHESIRGVGLHKSRALFGPEIYEEFKKLNSAYAWFVAQPKNENWIEKESQHLNETLRILETLPELFRPYVYFGNYRD